MRENQVAGRIICIGSPTGQRGNFGQTNYAAAKAGIVGMVRTWALELKRAGITANAVIPVAATAMTATVPYFAAAVEADEKGEAMPAFFRHDLGFGTSDDVAGLIAYLASDAAAAVTGQAIGVGGDRCSCGRTPRPSSTAYREGGWTYDALADRTSPTQFGGRCSRSARSSRRCPKSSSARRRPVLERAKRDETPMTRYEPAIDVDALTAIDVHVHIEVDASRSLVAARRPRRRGGQVLQHRRTASRPRQRRRVLPRAAHGRRGVHGRRRDATSAMPPLSSADIAEGAARNNDVLIPFGSVDPLQARPRSTTRGA